MNEQEKENLMNEVRELIKNSLPKQETGLTPMLHNHSGGDSTRIRLQDATGGFKAVVSDPNTVKGKIVYGDTNAKFRGSNGTEWKDLAWSDDLPVSFGGDGSDGACSINNEDTIGLGGAEVFVKNYSSINISGTGDMNFTNSHANGTIVIIKCSGDATIAGTISVGDATTNYVGAAGGTGGAGNPDVEIAGANGTVGSDPTGEWDTENDHGGDYGEGAAGQCGGAGGGGGQVANGTAGSGGSNVGTNGAAGTRQYYFVGVFNRNHQRKTYFVSCGSGGGGGAGGSGNVGGTVGNGGDGGRGGGALILEVAGTLNVTGGAIYARGEVGEDGENGGNYGDPKFPRSGGGGGGGTGGTVIVLYKGTLTGTLTPSVTGGAGGSGGTSGVTCTGGSGGTGANGSYIFEQYIW